MPISQENKVVTLKYAAKTFGKMSEDERRLSAYDILLKIHVIVGWVIPASELMDILTDQFEKKLSESYANVNREEFEYAFRNRGLDIKDWGKSLNLTMIDEVMLPYLENRFDLSVQEEKLLNKNNYGIEEKKGLTDQEWEEWLNDMKHYDFKILPCIAYDYLTRKGLINLSNRVKHEYMNQAIAHLLGTIEPLSKKMEEFIAMKKEGKFSIEITSSLVIISKRLAVSDYLKNN